MRAPAAEDLEDRDWAIIYEGTTAGCEISFLDPNTVYEFRAAGLAESEDLGTYSEVVSFKTPADDAGESPGEEPLHGKEEERDHPTDTQAGEEGSRSPTPLGQAAMAAAAAPSATAAQHGGPESRARHESGAQVPVRSPATKGPGPQTPGVDEKRRRRKSSTSSRAGEGGKKTPPAPPSATVSPPDGEGHGRGRRRTQTSAHGDSGVSTASGTGPPKGQPGSGDARATATGKPGAPWNPPPPPPPPPPSAFLRLPAPPTKAAPSDESPPSPGRAWRSLGAPTSPTRGPPHPKGTTSSKAGAAARMRLTRSTTPSRTRPSLPQRVPGSPGADQSADRPGIHAKLHALHAVRMRRLAARRAESESKIMALASSPKAGRPPATSAAPLSPRSMADKRRPNAVFMSTSPRCGPATVTHPFSPRKPVSGAKALLAWPCLTLPRTCPLRHLRLGAQADVPGPGAYASTSSLSAFPDKAALRRLTSGAVSAFRSTSPRLARAPRDDLPGPGSYDLTSRDSIASRASSPRKGRRKMEPFSSSSPRLLPLVRRDADEIPGPGAYNVGSRQGPPRRGLRGGFGSATSPRFRSTSARSEEQPGPFHYSLR